MDGTTKATSIENKPSQPYPSHHTPTSPPKNPVGMPATKPIPCRLEKCKQVIYRNILKEKAKAMLHKPKVWAHK